MYIRRPVSRSFQTVFDTVFFNHYVSYNDTAPSDLYPLSYTTLFRSTTLAQASDLDGAASLWVVREFARTLGLIAPGGTQDRKSTRLNSSHPSISYAVFCLKKKKATFARSPYEQMSSQAAHVD